MALENLLEIVRVETRHLEKIKQIESECGLSNWSLSEYRKELERADSIFYICEINGQPVGFLLARLITNQKYDSELKEQEEKLTKRLPASFGDVPNNFGNIVESEAEIYNIGIRKEFRRKGIGTLLFQKLSEISRRNGVKKIWLEVRISNTGAIAFYESEGFVITGTRKSLYTNPCEDGFIMCLNI